MGRYALFTVAFMSLSKSLHAASSHAERLWAAERRQGAAAGAVAVAGAERLVPLRDGWEVYGVQEQVWKGHAIHDRAQLSDGLKVRFQRDVTELSETGFIVEATHGEFLFVGDHSGISQPITDFLLENPRLFHNDMSQTRKDAYIRMNRLSDGKYLQDSVKSKIKNDSPCVVLLGKTGAGKSTLASVLQLNDDTLLRIGGFSPDFPASSENVSMTKLATLKNAYWRGQVDTNARPVVIVDTPGFGDSAGDDASQHLFEKTVATLQDMERSAEGMGGVSAFILVIKATGERWDDRVNDMIKQCSETFTNSDNSIWERLHVVFTHWEECVDKQLEHVSNLYQRSQVEEDAETERQDGSELPSLWSLIGTPAPSEADTSAPAEHLSAEENSQLDERLEAASPLDEAAESRIIREVLRMFAEKRERDNLVRLITTRFQNALSASERPEVYSLLEAGLDVTIPERSTDVPSPNEFDSRIRDMVRENRFYFCNPNSCGRKKEEILRRTRQRGPASDPLTQEVHHQDPRAAQTVTDEMARLFESITRIQREKGKFITKEVQTAANIRTAERKANEQVHQLNNRLEHLRQEYKTDVAQKEVAIKALDQQKSELELRAWAGLYCRQPIEYVFWSAEESEYQKLLRTWQSLPHQREDFQNKIREAESEQKRSEKAVKDSRADAKKRIERCSTILAAKPSHPWKRSELIPVEGLSPADLA